ncbi:MAG: FmdB family zinc ribbon protein [Acidimicrobiales bacterium]
MAMYEYHCPVCDERLSRLRPMVDADEPVTCSAGHPARRLISVVAGMAGGREAAPVPASGGGGGGCCGGACGCGR